MKRLWDKFWNWVFDIDGVRTESVFASSISGKPLVKFRSSLSGWSMWQTDEGLKGTHIHTTITQLGNNVETIKSLLKGEYADYISHDNYKRIVQTIRKRLEDGGYYLTTQRNRHGNLDFVRVYWSKEDKEEIKKLLEVK